MQRSEAHQCTFATNSGNSWELSSLIEQGLELDQFYGAVSSLDFLEDRKLAEFSDYNNFSGEFSQKVLGVKLDPRASTKKTCSRTGKQGFIFAIKNGSQHKVDKNKVINSMVTTR